MGSQKEGHVDRVGMVGKAGLEWSGWVGVREREEGFALLR